MDKGKIKELVQSHFKDIEEWGGGKNYRTYHSFAIADICDRIAKEEQIKVDEDALFLASVSHDLRKDEVVFCGLVIYKLERYKEIDVITSEYLGNFYKELNLDIDLLDKAARIVTEKDNGHPEYIESSILFDADELVNFGHAGVWRHFSFQGYLKNTMLDAMNNWFRSGKDSQLEVMRNLKFDFSKKLAKQRIERCDKFYTLLKQEVECRD